MSAPRLTLLLFTLLVPACAGAAPRDPVARSDAASSPASVAASIPHAASARRALEAEVASIGDEALRAAVRAQLSATSMPGPLTAGVLAERLERLRTARLIDDGAGAGPLTVEGDSFWVAPGGPCPDGHHAYPGGLAVHTLANVRHAVALAALYRDVYGVSLREDWLRAAALWHDSGKAYTLRWRADGPEAGSCGSEGKLGGTAAHHVLGIATAIARKLPAPLVVVIASAHAAPAQEGLEAVCRWLKAGSLLATGAEDAVPCPGPASPPPLEAFVHHLSDSDYLLTSAALAAALAGTNASGWDRFAPLRTASELQILGGQRQK